MYPPDWLNLAVITAKALIVLYVFDLAGKMLRLWVG